MLPGDVSLMLERTVQPGENCEVFSTVLDSILCYIRTCFRLNPFTSVFEYYGGAVIRNISSSSSFLNIIFHVTMLEQINTYHHFEKLLILLI